MKRLIIALLTLCSFAVQAEPVQAVPVLMYHRVTTAEPPSDLVISPRGFTLHIDTIKAAGYNTVTMSDLGAYMRGEKVLPPKPVVITFDDGWKDNLSAAMNLRDRGMVATFFVLSGAMESPLYLNAAEIEAISKHHEIGSHTHTHFMQWADELPSMDNRVMVGEIAMSKLIIEDVIGRPVKSFAWPFGYSREQLNTYLKGLGYDTAVLVNNESMNVVGQNPMQIRRIAVNGGCTPAQLIRLIETKKLGACNEEDSRLVQGPVR